jgi:hypothetical protein
LFWLFVFLCVEQSPSRWQQRHWEVAALVLLSVCGRLAPWASLRLSCVRWSRLCACLRFGPRRAFRVSPMAFSQRRGPGHALDSSRPSVGGGRPRRPQDRGSEAPQHARGLSSGERRRGLRKSRGSGNTTSAIPPTAGEKGEEGPRGSTM